MYRLKSDLLYTMAFGILSGVLSTALFVRPYFGAISLSELVLQLSGSRGTYAFTASITELMDMYVRFLPSVLFELYAGTVLYRCYCTASVYVFTRSPNRARWYRHEVCRVLFLSVLFIAASLLITVVLSMTRYQVAVNAPGIVLGLYHLILCAIWVFTVSVLLNVFSILLGSHISALLAVGIQAVCIAFLILIRREDQLMAAALVRVNPVAHLVLGWFNSAIPAVDEAIAAPYKGFSFGSSLLVVSLYCLAAVRIGRQLVLHHDILSGNAEWDGG